jgi:hypothetical protein
LLFENLNRSPDGAAKSGVNITTVPGLRFAPSGLRCSSPFAPNAGGRMPGTAIHPQQINHSLPEAQILDLNGLRFQYNIN